MVRIEDFQQIGECGVDSGTIMIIDPCYVLQDDDVPSRPSYQDFLDQADAVRGEHGSFGYIAFNLGVIAETLYGDGTYKVFARLNEEGQVCQMLIDFEQVLEDEEDETDWDDYEEDYDDEEDYEDEEERDFPDDLAG